MRASAALLLLLAFAAPPALAGVYPTDADTAPECIWLVCSNGGVPAAVGQFTYIARGFDRQTPVPGQRITIDLSGCLELFICEDQLDPATTVNCAAKTVTKFTGADGSVQFTVLGWSNGSGNGFTLLHGGRIYRNGTLSRMPTISAFDLDGAGGVGANDLSAWLTDFASGQPFGRSDYDCSGVVGANDLSIWITVFGSGTMTASCGVTCPF